MIAGARRSKVAHDRMGNLLTATLDGGAGRRISTSALRSSNATSRTGPESQLRYSDMVGMRQALLALLIVIAACSQTTRFKQQEILELRAEYSPPLGLETPWRVTVRSSGKVSITQRGVEKSVGHVSEAQWHRLTAEARLLSDVPDQVIAATVAADRAEIRVAIWEVEHEKDLSVYDPGRMVSQSSAGLRVTRLWCSIAGLVPLDTPPSWLCSALDSGPEIDAGE